MKFKIGDTAWFARANKNGVKVECPDCAGTRRIRLILANDEQISIDCGGCSRGYEGCSGTVTEYKFKADVRQGIITGLEETKEKTTYRIGQSEGWGYSFDSNDLFDNEEDALKRCHELIAKEVEQEKDRLLRKEKDTRTWTWNASYHRRNIREAEKQILYHTAKLNVAKFKAKEIIPDPLEGAKRDADASRRRP